MKFFVFVILFQAISLFSAAQTLNYRIVGKVVDAENTQVGLQGVSISSTNLRVKAISNELGKFTLQATNQLPDSIEVQFRYFGYLPKVVKLKTLPYIDLGSISLEAISTKTIEINSNSNNNLPTINASNSYDKITTNQAKLLPQFMGETDLLRILQMRPGVATSGDASSSLYVRGGGPDQNLILLDGATIYNPSHLFGFFSVFNGDAIKDLTLYKAGFPGRFGGRLSSVIDIRSNTGSTTKASATASIGLLSTRLKAESPFNKGKGSIVLSARRTYIDIFTRAVNKQNINKPDYEPIPDYYFYDANLGAKYQVSDRDLITITGLYGRDVLQLTGQEGFQLNTKWGNEAMTLKWDHVCNKRLMAQYRLSYSGYTYQTGYDYGTFNVKVGSSVRDFTAATDFLYELSDKIDLEFGAGSTSNSYIIGQASASSSNQDFSFSSGKFLSSSTNYTYIQTEYKPTTRLKFNGSLRASYFSRAKQQFHGFEPRFIATYKLNSRINLTSAYSFMYQYMHLMGNSGSSLPSDVWYPAGSSVKPQSSSQLSFGYLAQLDNDNTWNFSNDYYYKSLNNQIDFKDGAGTFSNSGLDSSLIFGKGWTYGGEFFLEKKKGRTTGWLGYTLSYSWRQFDAINQGSPFHPRYDRRHDINVVITHKLSTRISFSGTWVYGSGNYITLPQGRYLFQDLPGTVNKEPGYTVLPDIAQRNSTRMAAYHRMDISITYNMKVKQGQSSWNFSVFNLYNRQNPYFIYFQNVYANANRTGNITGFAAKQVSLIPILPSLSYTRVW